MAGRGHGGACSCTCGVQLLRVCRGASSVPSSSPECLPWHPVRPTSAYCDCPLLWGTSDPSEPGHSHLPLGRRGGGWARSTGQTRVPVPRVRVSADPPPTWPGPAHTPSSPSHLPPACSPVPVDSMVLAPPMHWGGRARCPHETPWSSAQDSLGTLARAPLALCSAYGSAGALSPWV